MPRYVRNFSFDAEVDGKRSHINSGPQSPGGGLVIWLYQRDRGAISAIGRIEGIAYGDGKLLLTYRDEQTGKIRRLAETER